jgi:hypothetical protein
MERAVILGALRKTAAHNGGQPRTEKQLRSNRNFSRGLERQAYDTGYASTGRPFRRDDELLLTRGRGRPPLRRASHLDFYARRHPGFPSHATFTARFVSHRIMFERLRSWPAEKPDLADIVRLCQEGREAPSQPAASNPVDYLLRAVEYCKIGGARILEKRIGIFSRVFQNRWN